VDPFADEGSPPPRDEAEGPPPRDEAEGPPPRDEAEGPLTSDEDGWPVGATPADPGTRNPAHHSQASPALGLADALGLSFANALGASKDPGRVRPATARDGTGRDLRTDDEVRRGRGMPGEVGRDEGTRGEVSHDRATRSGATRSGATRGEVGRGEVGRGEVRRGGARRGGVNPGEVKREQAERDEAETAREICLRQLALRPRTRAELARALARKGISAEVAAEVLDRYDDVGIIDDAAFARAWVSSRHHGRGLARRALANELRQRGVDRDAAGAALDDLDPGTEAETARALVDRKLRTIRGEPDAVFRRLVGMLARKGYPAGVALGAVKEALARQGAEAAEFADQVDADALAEAADNADQTE
jgi:regulatory protein